MTRTLLTYCALWLGTGAVQAAVLCQKKTGALFVRTICGKNETQADATALLGTLPGRVTTLETAANEGGTLPTRLTTVESTVAALQANGLTKTGPGIVAGYATVASNGTLVESYSSNGGTVTASHPTVSFYRVAFGFQIRPNQPIIAAARESFGREGCFIFQGTSAKPNVDVFCFDPGGIATDVAFTLVVFK